MLGYSVAVIIASLYLFSLFLAVLFMQPLFCLMSSVLSLTAVAVLFKGKPVWLKIVVISIFLVFGAFYLFYNNIVGPMSFQIADMPFDMPGQWHHSYRFFWVGIYVESVCFIASTISVLILLLYSYWPKIKSFPRKFWEIWCS